MQNTVCTENALSVRAFQILSTQRIHSRRIKTGKKHIDYDQNVQFLIHAKRHIFISFWNLYHLRYRSSYEHFVIILDYFFQKLSGRLVDRYKQAYHENVNFSIRAKSLRFKTQNEVILLHKLALYS